MAKLLTVKDSDVMNESFGQFSGSITNWGLEGKQRQDDVALMTVQPVLLYITLACVKYRYDLSC